MPPLSLPHLRRPRLEAVLDRAIDTPATVLVAPAAYGKTALVRAWSKGRPVHWASGPALAQLGSTSGSGDTRRPPGWPPLGDGNACPTGGPHVVVVDDVDGLGPADAQLLGALLTDAPETVRLILLARAHPWFVPGGLALSGLVATVGPADLLFTDAEAGELVRAHHPAATDGDVAAAQDASRGWAAALTLAGGSLQPGRAPLLTPAALLDSPVLRALLQENVRSQPVRVRDLLVATCAEERITAGAAAVLSGADDAGQLLTALGRDRWLVAPVLQGTVAGGSRDGGPGWLLHPLVRALLQQQVDAEPADHDLFVAAQQRATAHHGSRGAAEAALHHATLTGDPGTLVRTITRCAPALLAAGRQQLVADALTRARQHPARFPRLVAVEALVARLQVDAEHELTTTDAALDQLPDLAAGRVSVADGQPGAGCGPLTDRNWYADLATTAVWAARRGWRDQGNALAHAGRVLGCRHDAAGGDQHDLAGISPLRAAWLLLDTAGLEMWRDDLPAAALHLTEAGQITQLLGLPRLSAACLGYRATLEMVDGEAQTGAATARECLRLAAAAGLGDGPHRTRAQVVIGWAAFLRLDEEEAQEWLQTIGAGRSAPLEPLVAVYLELLSVGVLTIQGRFEEARRQLAARTAAPPNPPPYAARVLRILRAQAAALSDDLAGLARQTAAIERDGRPGEDVTWQVLLRALTGRETEALAIAEDGLTETGRAVSSNLALQILYVALLHRLGDPDSLDRARRLVPALLGAMGPQRMLWGLTLGLPVSPSYGELFEQEARRRGADPLAGEVATALAGFARRYQQSPGSGAREDERTGPVPRGSGAPGPAEPPEKGSSAPRLTQRQVEVLHQVALGQSVREIARTLFVSENTVKTHLTSIYRQLGVDRRMDALQVSRELGIIPTPPTTDLGRYRPATARAGRQQRPRGERGPTRGTAQRRP